MLDHEKDQDPNLTDIMCLRASSDEHVGAPDLTPPHASCNMTANQELEMCVARHRAELRELLARWIAPAEPDTGRDFVDLTKSPAMAFHAVQPTRELDFHGVQTAKLCERKKSDASLDSALRNCVLNKLGIEEAKDRSDEITGRTHAQDGAPDSSGMEKAKDRGSERCSLRRRSTQGKLEGISRMIVKDGLRYEDNCCGSLMKHHRFDQVCAFFITCSSVVVGLEVELKTASNEGLFKIFQYAFMVIFTLELLLRMRARGQKFFNGRDKGWSFFDIMCVGSSYLELAYSFLGQAEDGSLFLMARTLRILRIARIIRVVRFLSQLRMMVYTMLGAVRILIWMVLLLFMIVYTFGVCLYEAVKPVVIRLEEVAEHDQAQKNLQKHFGSLLATMLTLFQSITGGISWDEAFRALSAIPNSSLYSAMFLMYICLVVFTILNVITGICCEHAMASAEKDKEDVIRQRLQDREGLSMQYKQVFEALDNDGSGEISGSEFAGHLNDEEFQAYLEHLNISIYSAADMFQLLDQDNSGSVSIEEFVMGCMRMQGPAKTMDILKIGKDLNMLATQVQKALLSVRSKSK
eukprot:TRINITY_DN29638_c0_g1_i1.p1 TRINITY_DN29638_c0_g1~~TRINITY_DN29638_c0_g1_i1.p1  ORF type:complete len:609 (-),score=107.26 TRINITY_DN29638_c0_g1_i1:78-1811(-)